ncbi:hypothetical protein ACN20G_34845 (plasmid) [Streptomyces sp. BI20]|uniref:hypothetical protein n=1 Tax=Streptomyces sp. BI20 TaxID=3403460 RepID=UPI003C727C91
MTITEHTLAAAWREAAAAHPPLRDLPPPLLVHTEDEVDRWSEHAETEEDAAPCVLLEADGTARVHDGPWRELLATRDLDRALYLIAEAALGRRAAPEETALALERIDPTWGARFRTGSLDATETPAPCGRDPLDGFAWIARTWREQHPYTELVFHRAAPGRSVDPESLALLYGADPEQVANGTRLKDLWAPDDGRTHQDRQWKSCCFGQVGAWTYLLHHETPPGAYADKEAYAALGIEESVFLSATMAKAIYTVDHIRHGRRLDDDEGVFELIWYDRGRAPHPRTGELDFVNRALRRAEMDHPELTDEFALYFHALEEALGIGLPRHEFEAGLVRTAYWAEPRE